MRLFFQTKYGQVFLADALEVLATLDTNSVDLIITSPPFGLVRKKEYGNVDAEEYLDWFRPFAQEFRRILTQKGSFVIDIGGSWIQGLPVRSLYHFKLLIMFCEEFGFHLAQDFYWWNPSKLPTPAEWVTVRRIRVKDAINCVWWLSKSPFPKASNRRVLHPYSESMKALLKNGYRPKKRPSGHDISDKFANDNKAAIPPNLLAIPNTESNSYYLKYCQEHNIKPHPARFPTDLPEYFIRMLTNRGDFVVDPFAGSCVTGEVCEKLTRKWICVDLVEDYLRGGLARFHQYTVSSFHGQRKYDMYYKIPHPGIMWDQFEKEELPKDGGKSRPKARIKKRSQAEQRYLFSIAKS